MNLTTIASILAIPCSQDALVRGVCIDSRLLKPGDLFVAVKGDRFDGHDFIREAASKGAVAVVAAHAVEPLDIPVFVVPDPVIALAQIAAAHRQSMHCPVIALTGSNGKTTVKEMIAAILPQPSWATKGNLNNHLGAPLSALGLNAQHRYAVFELGANHPGEIAHTAAIVRPDVTLINNIAPAHVEGFGSIDGVARAKGEIHQSLSAAGTAVINDDDAYAHFWDAILENKRTIHFSVSNPDVAVHAEELQFDSQGRAQFLLILPNAREFVALQVPGLHNVRNALAAAACCYAVGISIQDIQRGLNRFAGVKGRMTVLAGKNQSTIIDDTYNANLRSVLAALEVLSERAGKKIFVFGDMGELGEWSAQHHQEVGVAARTLGIDMLLTCGKHSALTASAFGETGRHYASKDELTQAVMAYLAPGTTVLVKGSRSSAMEHIVQQLLRCEEQEEI